MGLPLQSQSESESFGFGRGPPPQGQQHQLRVGPPLQGDFVRRVVPRPAPTRGRGTSGLHTNAIRSDEIPLQRRPSQPWCSPFRRAKSLAQSRSHSRQSVLDGIDEATDMQVAKDAVVRGSGASRPWMACARLLEPGMAQPSDAHDPRTAAAPPEGDKSRRFGSGQKPASPQRRTKPVDSGAFQPGRILNQSPEKNLIPGLPGGPGTAGSTPRPCVVPPSGPG